MRFCTDVAAFIASVGPPWGVGQGDPGLPEARGPAPNSSRPIDRTAHWLSAVPLRGPFVRCSRVLTTSQPSPARLGDDGVVAESGFLVGHVAGTVVGDDDSPLGVGFPGAPGLQDAVGQPDGLASRLDITHGRPYRP